MKITYVDIYKFFVYLILFVNLGFLNIYDNKTGYFLVHTGIWSLGLFIIYLTQKKKASLDFKFEKLIISLYFIYLLFQVIRIWNCEVTSVSLRGTIRLNLMYLIVLLVFPIKEIIYYDGYKKFFKNIFLLGMLASILKSMVFIFYNYFGITIMQGIINERGIDWVRNGNLRLTATFLDGFIFCYALYMILKKHKKIYIFSVLYEFWYAIIVYQSRSQMLCFIGTLIIMFIFKNSNYKKTFLNILLISLCIFFILKTVFFQRFLQSFSITNIQNGAGTQIRIDAFNYYLQQWLHFNVPFGLGLISDGTDILTFNLGMHKVYLSDLGILGTLFRLGIVGLSIWIFPMIYGVFRSLINIKKNPIALLSLGLTVYIILSSLMSQNVYDGVRIPILPIWIIIIFLSGLKNNN